MPRKRALLVSHAFAPTKQRRWIYSKFYDTRRQIFGNGIVKKPLFILHTNKSSYSICQRQTHIWKYFSSVKFISLLLRIKLVLVPNLFTLFLLPSEFLQLDGVRKCHLLPWLIVIFRVNYRNMDSLGFV
jgi:hypothetical protein